MPQEFAPGDFLVFQLESGYGLLRLLGVEKTEDGNLWHLSAYRDLFMDVDSAERAIDTANDLTIEIMHVALTNRAFESTQVARIANVPLTVEQAKTIADWQTNADHQVHDRSIRLLLGLR